MVWVKRLVILYLNALGISYGGTSFSQTLWPFKYPSKSNLTTGGGNLFFPTFHHFLSLSLSLYIQFMDKPTGLSKFSKRRMIEILVEWTCGLIASAVSQESDYPAAALQRWCQTSGFVALVLQPLNHSTLNTQEVCLSSLHPVMHGFLATFPIFSKQRS